jgi:hypothetical protein
LVAEERDRKGLSLDYLKDRLEIPWISDDLDPKTSEDAELKKRIADQVAVIRKDLSKKELAEGSFAYQLEFGRRLSAYFRLDRKEGGFGLAFDSTELSPRSLVQIDRDRKASCIDFANLFLMAADLAGLPVVPVELLKAGSETQHHVALAFLDPLDAKSIRSIIDLQASVPLGPPLTSETWSILPRRDFLAHYHIAKGVRDPDAKKGEAQVDLALDLSPSNYLALFDKSYWEALRGDYQRASAHLRASIVSNPIYSRAYWNLHIIAKAMNDAPTSHWALDDWKRVTR